MHHSVHALISLHTGSCVRQTICDALPHSSWQNLCSKFFECPHSSNLGMLVWTTNHPHPENAVLDRTWHFGMGWYGPSYPPPPPPHTHKDLGTLGFWVELILTTPRPSPPSGGFTGGAPGARPDMVQNFLDFMHFFVKFDKIVCWRPPGGLAPPPTGNPGSVHPHPSRKCTFGHITYHFPLSLSWIMCEVVFGDQSLYPLRIPSCLL